MMPPKAVGVRGSSPVILNLGCGTRTHDACVNIDWSPLLRLKSSFLGRTAAPLLLSGARYKAFETLADDIMVCDLRNGLPFPDSSVDGVYHSHALEHIDRAARAAFFAEILRVLTPGGVHRVVVPNLEQLASEYRANVAISDDLELHESFVAGMIEQMVRREAAGTSQQPRFRRWLENHLLGDARRRGETHQWMYDYKSLGLLLKNAGFVHVNRVGVTTSAMSAWQSIRLDLVGQPPREYKPGFLYMEASKPTPPGALDRP